MCYLLNQIHVRLFATCALQILCTCYRLQLVVSNLSSKFIHGLTDSRLIMDYFKKSVVWQLVRKDEENEDLVWCKINNCEECKQPIRRSGNIPKMYSTAIIRNHFSKYHPEELAAAFAEKRKMEENLTQY